MPLTWKTFEYMRAHFNDVCGVAEIVLIDCDYMTCPKKKLTKIYHILKKFVRIECVNGGPHTYGILIKLHFCKLKVLIT